VSREEENRRLLALHHPKVLEALGALGVPTDRIRLVPTATGDPTAVMDGILLHSRYDPRRDASQQVEREIDPEATAVIILGFGLGYSVEAVRRRLPVTPLLVVEPDAEIFRAAVDGRDLTALLSDTRIAFHVGGEPEALAGLLEALPLARPGYLRLRPEVERSPAAFRAAEEVVQSWILRRDININTLNRFGRLWVRNLCRNMKAFLDCPGISSLEGLFAGMPAVLLAGGPSLDALLPRLREVRERALVVAVNTPLRPCQEAGVEPDFTVVVDPQYWASRYLDWTTSRRGVMVAEPSTHPRVFRRPGARFFLCSSLFPLGETLETSVGAKGKLGAGGSVATSAWDLARVLGVNPLFTAGLDLGFPGLRTHCKGAYVEDSWHAASGRTATVEGSAFRSLREIGLFAVRSASGGFTLTDRRMLLYKWWFENQLTMRHQMESCSLSPDGVAIRGMQRANVDRVLSLPVIRPEIERRMDGVRSLQDEPAARLENAARLREGVVRLLDELDSLADLSRRGLSLSRELGAVLSAKGDPGPSLRLLDEVDEKILDVSARNVAGFLIQSVIHGIAALGESRAGPDEVVSRSVSMYEGIEESAGWQKALLSRALRSLREDGR
jgi:Protein of unknown function DUF115/Glycosyltransferase Maf N-terminal domain